eukprot:NODE_4619_length_766_cov_49.774648_g4596_i0.p1 GENE.NODE_4619_length_766_cov_49.774648_g4596_i0~~NODE_4619_length_766_cov_49.774648_g4596_i0.p1  ORF type:complete len:205 (-),score=38.65 NODE_4619_length_766_cov_49.774648_g4596_i0:152-706(-)
MAFRKKADGAPDWSNEIVVTTNDDIEFVVPKSAAVLAKVLQDILVDTDGTDETIIPITNVDAATLETVAPYLHHYADKEVKPIEKPLRAPLTDLLNEWDRDYVYKTLFQSGDEKRHECLFKTLMAANFLGIEPLRDLCCAAIANMLRGKTPEQIMEVFNVTEPFTPEEEAQVDEEFPWLKEAEQ